ncbi:MAG: MFS transporter [Deltaproteobacteria bacterium]|nr:MFS transporter [Deltaproteobacteria bacterium]MCK5710311.1 MFS transporter [Deltaproteobacteria bacterium]
MTSTASSQDSIDTTSANFPVSKSVGRWVLLATILGSGMAFIDSTAMNVVIPVLQSELNATIPQVQWIMEAYALFMSSLMLLGGSLGDKFGRKRIFALGVVLFTGASIWCGLSPNTSQLIIARAFQGAGGALLIPGSLAIVNISFSDEHRGRAFGIWSGFTAITTTLGPILGGWLAQNLSWRYVFFINVPLALIVLGVLYWRIPESKKGNGDEKLDLWGSLLATLGLGCIVFGLIDSGNIGFGHPKVIIPFIAGGLFLLGFLFYESRTSSPMMPLNLFKSKTFSGGNFISLLFWAAWSGAIFFIPFNLIQLQGYSAVGVGLAFVPLVIVLFLFSPWAGGLVAKYGAKLLIIAGTILASIGFYLFTLPGIGGSYWTTFFPAITILGIGMAIIIPPVTTAVMGSVELKESGVASGINNTVGRIAGLLAIAAMGVFALSTFSRSLDYELDSIDLQQETRQYIDDQRIKILLIDIPENVETETKTYIRGAIDRSFLASFRLMMLISAGLVLLGAFVAWFTIERMKPD